MTTNEIVELQVGDFVGVLTGYEMRQQKPIDSWLARRTKKELYQYTCGRLRELRRQTLYGRDEFRFIAENALKSLEEIKTTNPLVFAAAIASMKAKFDV